MNLNIVDFQDAEIDHLQACIVRAAWMAGGGNVKTATIYVTPRDKHGWLEYITRYEYENGGGLTVGAIQREPGAPVEFHS